MILDSFYMIWFHSNRIKEQGHSNMKIQFSDESYYIFTTKLV